jgi:signal peptidase II
LIKFGSPALATRRRTILKWSLLVVIAAIALAIDLVTKNMAEQNLVLGESQKILPFLYLERTANTGVAFGIFSGGGVFIIVANLIALAVVVFYVTLERRYLLAAVAGGLIIGGSLGNLYQRVTADGRVTDFLKFPHWPNFNMADVFVDIGIAIVFIGLIVEMVRVYKAGRRTQASS